MQIKTNLLCILLIISGNLFTQNQAQLNNARKSDDKYWIYFTDKNNSSFSVNDPLKFLSPRAIDRRDKFSISINGSDIPVNQDYIQQINDFGIEVITASRWLNAVSANLSLEQIVNISQLQFVKEIAPVNKYFIVDENTLPHNNNVFYKTSVQQETEGDFGVTATQIDQINLDTILDLGFTGNDLVIAVLDAGFFGVDTATLFQSFWDKSQILGYRNFPDNNNEVFNIYSGYHGSWVLSVIGGDIDSFYSGSAPDADFYLFRTEIAETEYVVEEDFWLEAAESADSVGADIINSSLGYTTFDDSTQNHTYADLDGNTTVVTMAADMAAEKGILVCNSAGNEGANSWHYISMPSDGDSVFSIGGVDSSGIHVSFSGFGPTSDGRLKPNVVALASNSAVLDPNGYLTYLSGTSFSSPLIAGACASLWQAFPLVTNMQIINAVHKSASLYLNPNDSMGYGIPDFGLAYEIIKAQLDSIANDTIIEDTTTVTIINILPNPANDYFTVFILSHLNEPATIQIVNLQGEMMYEENVYLTKNVIENFSVSNMSNFTSGIYVFSLLTLNSKQSELLFVN